MRLRQFNLHPLATLASPANPSMSDVYLQFCDTLPLPFVDGLRPRQVCLLLSQPLGYEIDNVVHRGGRADVIIRIRQNRTSPRRRTAPRLRRAISDRERRLPTSSGSSTAPRALSTHPICICSGLPGSCKSAMTLAWERRVPAAFRRLLGPSASSSRRSSCTMRMARLHHEHGRRRGLVAAFRHAIMMRRQSGSRSTQPPISFLSIDRSLPSRLSGKGCRAPVCYIHNCLPLRSHRRKPTELSMNYDGVFNFLCPKCQASYKVVRCPWPPVAGPQLSCLVCNQSLAPHDGDDILKYFLVVRGKHTLGGALQRGEPDGSPGQPKARRAPAGLVVGVEISTPAA